MRPAFLLAALVLFGACEAPKSARRFTRDETAEVLKRLEVVSLELGEFPIDGSSAVIDGDTVRVKGLNASLRLLAIDAEETFKHAEERAAFAGGWVGYKKKMRGTSSRPVKYPTPLGEDGKQFAEGFFDGISTVRIERDHPGEIRDYYNRYLAYIFAKKDGQWVNFNIEIVRAGLSPYFVKYGRSRRFHKEFLDAQKQAQEAKLGIWAPDKMHYDDYPERLKWWDEREQAITRFEKMMDENPDQFIALTRWDALLKLERKVGQTVTILGSVSEVKFGQKGPSVVRLARNRSNDFEVVFFDRDVLLASGLQYKKGEYVQVRGAVTKYRDTYRNVDKLQLMVNLPGQVIAPSRQLEELLDDKSGPTEETEGD